ncbi:MAG TPA: O-antigen polysaccharide polymerase Wzy [Vicinamibacterales bacterium]|nr:O-antigen polysaccharide polymerase Wzy [Vicinamibacterales bacterium]
MLWPNQRPSPVVLLAYAGATGTLALALALFGSARGPDPVDYFGWIAAASMVVAGSLIALAGVWSATGVYTALFWGFHFGLIAAMAYGSVDPSELSAWEQSWVLSPFVSDAALMALAGNLALAAGASVVFARRGFPRGSDAPLDRRDPLHPLGLAGSVMVFLAIGLWCAIVLTTGGVSGFLDSYSAYLEATESLSVVSSTAWLVLGCGLVLAVTGKRGQLRRAALAAFGCLTLIVLPIGLRGEVLFRSMGALVAAGRCGRALSPARTLAFGLALLVAIPILREVRQTGLRAMPDRLPQIQLFEAFAEMGASLHPVEKVVRWRAEGEPLDKGGTYWAPFERAAARLLPGAESPEAEDDLRIMNVLVIDRVGPIGFSPVAEAYRNFGAAGVVLVLGLLGACLAGIDTIRSPRVAVITLAVVYVPILTNVRNSFVSVPAHCAAGLAIVVMLFGIRHMLGSIVARPYASSPYVRSEA